MGRNLDRGPHSTRCQPRPGELYRQGTAADRPAVCRGRSGRLTTTETEEERARLAPMVLVAVSDSTDFDIDTYYLKSQLAQENEDGD